MRRFFEGATEFAGNSKTGIRWPIAEKLSLGGCLVFGWYRDHDEVANELHHIGHGTRIFDVTPSVPTLHDDGTYASLGGTSSVVRVSGNVLSFERWFLAPGTRTVFLARGSDVDVPFELMEDALAALASLAATRIDEKKGQPQNTEKLLAAFARHHPFPEKSLAAFLMRPLL